MDDLITKYVDFCHSICIMGSNGIGVVNKSNTNLVSVGC